jgi:hypothetical protein
MREVEHVTRVGNNKNAYSILKRKSERKIPFGRSVCMWQDIKIRLGEQDGKACTGFFWFKIVCEHTSDSSVSVKCMGGLCSVQSFIHSFTFRGSLQGYY